MKKILTIILDGFGYREEEKGNATKSAEMKNFNKIWSEYPHALLDASEESVGLKEGQFGNSETGHMTIGAGRLIKQNETLVDDFLKSDVLNNESFNKLILDSNKTYHIIGLCSDGNVHAGIDDVIKMYELLIKNGVKSIYFHIITDGRDTFPHSSYKYISMIEKKIEEYNIGNIATICGRYYAMDRDKNYDRTKVYYDLIINGVGIYTNKINEIINRMYDKKITDEFIKPILVNKNGIIKNGDKVIWMNYRADRSKQILSSLINDSFIEFSVRDLSLCEIYSFFEIDKDIPTIKFIEKETINNSLGLYLSQLGINQARIAETEKFAHVTYFFDGGYSGKIPKCNFFHIPSPEVSTYNLKPEMSAIGVTKKTIECMMQDYDFILVNYANADMVGHTGDYDATVKACMVLDMCLDKLVEKAEENFYKVIILADHGNADIMIDDNDNIVTSHTLSKVPFIIMDNNIELNETGDLTMVAPTILEYMDIAVPDEMKESKILIK